MDVSTDSLARMVRYIRLEVLGRRCDLLVGKSSEDVGDDLVERLLVVRLKSVLVPLVYLLLGEVKINRHLLVFLELHDDERVSCLTLAQGRVQANAKKHVGLVWFGKHHKLLDGVVLDLVVVRLTTETERRIVHVDIETTSVGVSGTVRL